jgi:hypothetical protein
MEHVVFPKGRIVERGLKGSIGFEALAPFIHIEDGARSEDGDAFHRADIEAPGLCECSGMRAATGTTSIRRVPLRLAEWEAPGRGRSIQTMSPE